MNRTKTEALRLDWRALGLVLLVGLALTLSGCASPTASLVNRPPALSPAPAAPTAASELPAAYGEISGPAQELALGLTRWLGDRPEDNRLAVAVFVDLNDLERTSAFGRALSDSLTSYLHQLGFEVVELRRTSNLLIQPKAGEFYLSRQIKHLVGQHDVSAVVAGTYTQGLNMVVVNARLVSASDGRILSTSLVELPKSANLNYLLDGLGGPGGMAQIKAPRAARIPPAQMEVFERPAKGSAKARP